MNRLRRENEMKSELGHLIQYDDVRDRNGDSTNTIQQNCKESRTFTTMHIPWSIMLSITLSCNKILHSCLCHEHKHRQRTYSNRSNRQVPRSLVERRP
jgi:hypothetical protein